MIGRDECKSKKDTKNGSFDAVDDAVDGTSGLTRDADDLRHKHDSSFIVLSFVEGETGGKSRRTPVAAAL